MALEVQSKKGGRYTIKEQEERRIQVYHLHFEENRTAVKIAELLGVNRNTINGDIRYWHSQLAHEFNAQNITAKMTKQIQRIEMQRDRLLEYLDAAVENLCNTKIAFRTSGRTWVSNNFGKELVNEIETIETGTCYINTMKTSKQIQAKVSVPFVGDE